MVTTLKSFVGGNWVAGKGRPAQLFNPSTEEVVAEASSEGVDFARAVQYAREVGGRSLSALSFASRARILEKMAKVIADAREELIAIGVSNGGNTRSDAKFDIDGASATLLFYAELGSKLGDTKVIVDGEGFGIGRSARLYGQHVLVSRRGVAVHVNAFNFPAWGMAEKLAVSLLCGVPTLTKPATATAQLAFRIFERWVEQAAFPEGAVSFIAGGVGDLLSHLSGQDVLAFTGSGATAASLRRLENLAKDSVHVNVEADSLNAAVLGPDVATGSETMNLFLSEVTKEMTQKAGQKCTAVRRIYVPKDKLAEVRELLVERLSEVRVGNPADEKVTMGPLATKGQLADVRTGIERLAAGAEVALGGAKAVNGIGSPEGKGYFVSPTLIVRQEPKESDVVNAIEVFGPVATLMPYSGLDEVEHLVAAGGGGLVSSIYSDDKAFTQKAALALAPYHGRLTLGSEKLAGQSVSPGTVMPQLLHGGPGRAGGGEELGGMRGMALYLQRVALQGYRAVVEQIASGK